MLSLLLRNLFFTIVQPGVVAGLVPYLLLRYFGYEIIPQSLTTSHYVAATVFLIGFSIMTACILRFATEGKGTLSPLGKFPNSTAFLMTKKTECRTPNATADAAFRRALLRGRIRQTCRSLGPFQTPSTPSSRGRSPSPWRNDPRARPPSRWRRADPVDTRDSR
ncbi:MAG: hypothetical protein AB7Q37_02100 [Pyrinomonadaceae bacterium]